MKPKDNSILTAWRVVSDLIQVARWLPGTSPAFSDSGTVLVSLASLVSAVCTDTAVVS